MHLYPLDRADTWVNLELLRYIQPYFYKYDQLIHLCICFLDSMNPIFWFLACLKNMNTIPQHIHDIKFSGE